MSDATVIDATDRFPGDQGYMKRRGWIGKEYPEKVIDGIFEI